MATLIAVSFMEKTKTPFVWYCSECQEVFALGRMTAAPTITELHKVNHNFSLHCKEKHPKSPVVGLTITNPKEDASQAAVRVVREATEEN
jgi:hypothetical protein